MGTISFPFSSCFSDTPEAPFVWRCGLGGHTSSFITDFYRSLIDVLLIVGRCLVHFHFHICRAFKVYTVTSFVLNNMISTQACKLNMEDGCPILQVGQRCNPVTLSGLTFCNWQNWDYNPISWFEDSRAAIATHVGEHRLFLGYPQKIKEMSKLRRSMILQGFWERNTERVQSMWTC